MRYFIIILLFHIILSNLQFNYGLNLKRNWYITKIPLAREIRTLLIDNYDSYTYNLWQLLSEVNNISPVVILNDQYASWDKMMQDYGYAFDNIVLSPGPGTPLNRADVGISLDAISNCKVPLLGVCLGHQAIAQVYGASVKRASIPMHGRLSAVHHSGSDIFERIPNDFSVVRYHSLLVEDSILSDSDLVVTARSAHDNVIMGLKHKHKPIYGVQFHPESIATEYGRNILLNFYRITIAYHSQPTSKSSIKPMRHRQPIFDLKPDQSIKPKKYERHIHIIECSYDLNLSIDSLFEHLYGNSSASFWLDSSSASISTSGPSNTSSSYSFMGACELSQDFSIEYHGNDELIERYAWGRALPTLQSKQQNIFEYIHHHLSAEDNIKTSYHYDMKSNNNLQDILPFNLSSMIFGYIGYENRNAASHILNTKSPSSNRYDYAATRSSNYCENPWIGNLSHPAALFLCPSRYIIIDHSKNIMHIVSSTIDEISTADKREEQKRYAKDIGFDTKQRIDEYLAMTSRQQLSAVEDWENSRERLTSDKSQEQYRSNVESCLESIRAGDTYEVCLTMRYEGQASLNESLSIYRQLRKKNAAPYSSYIRYDPLQQYNIHNNTANMKLEWADTGGFAVLCSSPERYLKVDLDGIIETNPIKGTDRRDLKNITRDRYIATELENDEKSRAENLMIVDLMRNDLGRVCDIGSVHVPHLMKVETFASVHQLVSTIGGKLSQNMNIADALIATFPGGSMTGAPKQRTMDIIDGLENFPRGIYSGTIGYISMNGMAELNIVIRTAYIVKDRISIGSGGAIVILSDPAKEVDEVLLKAQSVGKAIGYEILFKENNIDST